MKKLESCKEHKSPAAPKTQKSREDQKPRPRGVRRDPHAEVIHTKPVPFPVKRDILWDNDLKPTPGVPPEYRLTEIPPGATPYVPMKPAPQEYYGKFGSGLAWSVPPQQPLAWYTSLWMWFSAWVANLFVTRSNRS